MTNYYIGFDNGTMGTKVAIYSEDSTLLAEYYGEHTIKYPLPGWAEMDPNQFYNITVNSIKKCVEKSKINPKKVRGISCSGIICGFVPIDKNWNAVGPYIPYLDGRAKDEAEYVSNSIEPIWTDECGNSEIGAYMPPLILKWISKNQKNVYKEIKKFVTACQYVLGKFGGLKSKDAFIDWAHMSGWIIGFDIEKRNWSTKQIELLGLDYDMFPKVKKPWEIIGTLTKAEAEKMGLIEGIPLIAGSGDIMQSNLGSGVINSGMSSDIAGTASIFTIELDSFNKKVTEAKTLYSSISTFNNQYLHWGFIPAGGLSLRWFRDGIVSQKENENFYKEMDKLAKKVPIGSNYLLFYPFLQGRSSPSWPSASSAFLGLYGSNKVGDLWRAMLESIAFEYLIWINIFKQIGININETVAIGGGSKSSLWNQIKADILNIKYITLEKSESAVMGNALLAGYGVGDIKDLKVAVKSWVKIHEVFNPDPLNSKIYNKIFKVREEILEGPLKEIFKKIHSLHINQEFS